MSYLSNRLCKLFGIGMMMENRVPDTTAAISLLVTRISPCRSVQ